MGGSATACLDWMVVIMENLSKEETGADSNSDFCSCGHLFCSCAPGVKAQRGHNRIILMDLNVALSSNFKDMRKYSFETFVKEVEEYRDWMVDLLRSEYVILITARNIKWGVHTLDRIHKLTNWVPNEALFNDTGISGSEAPLIKKTQFIEKVVPRHGDYLGKYYAIESNPRTREMYASIGVQAFDCEREGKWDRLPF